jgi:hypothetical protein
LQIPGARDTRERIGGGGKATRLARVPSLAPCRGQPRVYQNGQAM